MAEGRGGRIWAVAIAIALVLVLQTSAFAQNSDLHIQELMAGANGDSRIQFIVVQQHALGENLWGPREGELQSRAMLVFFDAADRMTGEFRFPMGPPTGGTLTTLIATQEFAALEGAPRPDVVIPPLLNAPGGKVCFRNNPRNALADEKNECVSYGGYAGETGISESEVLAGPPALPLPITNTVSLRRTVYTERNADFEITRVPTPLNTAGDTFVVPVATTVAQGETLFNNETFGGNGRTCASCHVAVDGLRLSPNDVQTRFEALVSRPSSYDPLFIGETAPSVFDAGFDFNLNTLELVDEVGTPAPCTGELRGVVADETGVSAKLFGRIGPTTYLIYGGVSPPLTGTVTDGTCEGGVRRVVPGDLAPSVARPEGGLEDPVRMRSTREGVFPSGRALILENIDGFENPPVFRKSPHLLNLASTAPYGLSGEFEDLPEFARGAVAQHSTRSLARSSDGPNPDFRMPTPDELAALESFMLAQTFPAGDDPNRFDLARFATTEVQKRGREEFFSFGCSTCHGGQTLSETTVSILGQSEGVNGRFNTGTASVSIRAALPCEPATETVGACGSREFSTPQLFNLPSLGPYFHNGSARTIAEAVEFYASFAFGRSPAGQELIFRGIGIIPTPAITTFLEGLVDRPYTLGEALVRFGPQSIDSPVPGVQNVSITNSTSEMLAFDSPACRIGGPNADDYVVNQCPLDTPLSAGETRVIRVAFAPGSSGMKSAILEIHPREAAPSGVDLFGVGGELGPAPDIATITPSSGGPGGGDRITLRGANFEEGATVTVGGVEAGWVEVVSSTVMTVRTGAVSPGLADVVVVNPDAQTAVLGNAYDVVGP